MTYPTLGQSAGMCLFMVVVVVLGCGAASSFMCKDNRYAVCGIASGILERSFDAAENIEMPGGF